jgi:hypothetical protein
MDIQSSIHNCGEKNIPGIKTRIHLICECDVETWPDRLATTGVDDSITLDGNIVPKSGKFFAEFDIITKTGEVKDTLVGVDGSKSIQQSLDFKKANTVGVAEWFNKHANMCAIAVVETKNGQKKVMGWQGSPVKIETAEGTTGMGPDTASEWTSQFMAHTGEVALIYVGTLPVAP